MKRGAKPAGGIRLKANVSKPAPTQKRALTRLERFQRLIAGRPDPKKVGVFLQQFATMLDNGVDMPQIFESVGQQQEHPRLIEVIGEIRDKILFRGGSLSRAMSDYPDIFPTFAVILARAGETGGDLAGRLRRASELMERNSNLAMQVRSALMSPLFTIGFSSLVILGVVKTIMPKFIDLYAQMELELPMISQVVIAIVGVVNHWSFWVLLIGTIAIFTRFKAPLSQKLFDVAVRIPRVKGWVGTVLCAELCDILVSLMREGVPIHTAIGIMATSAKFKTHREYLGLVSMKLRAEGSFEEAMREVPYFPHLFHSMCSIGVEMGSLDSMLEYVARLLEQQTEAVIDAMVNLLEPITICVTGLVMSFLFLGLFLPVYGILAKLGV